MGRGGFLQNKGIKMNKDLNIEIQELKKRIKDLTTTNNEFTQTYRKRNIDKLDKKVIELEDEVTSLKNHLSVANKNLGSNNQQEVTSLRYELLEITEEKESQLIDFRKKEKAMRSISSSLDKRVKNLESELLILKEVKEAR